MLSAQPKTAIDAAPSAPAAAPADPKNPAPAIAPASAAALDIDTIFPIQKDELLMTPLAKAEWFLSSSDLKNLPCKRPPVWGRGGCKYYRTVDCRAKAIEVYGIPKLMKMVEQRKMEERKRQLKEEAMEAAARKKAKC